MIPILFTEDTVSFNNNGLGHLVETLDYEVYEARNGQFELTLEYPITGKLFKELKDFRIILAKPNDTDEDHAFRIYEMIKDLETGSVVVHASTRSNDLAGNLITEVHIQNETPQEAMNKMVGKLIQPTDYRFVSDIQTRSSTDWIRRNPLNAIAGEEGSLVQYWGGELKRTNNTIYLYSRRGKDNVVILRQGKNLNGFTLTASTKGMVTRIVPYFTYTPEGRDEEVTITGSIVDSPLVNNYPVRYIQPVDYSGDDTVTSLATLNNAAKSYFTHQNPDIDKPSVNIEVDLVQLSDSSEYARFKGLEHVSLTDTVTVWVEKFDVDVTVKINELTYNGMKEQVTSIVAGSTIHSLYSDIGKSYTDKISELREYVAGMENGIRNVIQLTADGKNSIFRGYTEPSVDISNINDLWYKELGSGEKEVYIFDGAYWQPLITAGLNEAVRAEIGKLLEQAETDRLAAEQGIAAAIAAANEYADQQVVAFDDKVNAVRLDANEAMSKADGALTKAEQAISDAGFAKTDAGQAKLNAATALENANTASTNAATAISTANAAKSNAGTALTNANAALTRVGSVEETTGTLSTSYDNLTKTVGLKADQMTVDGIKGTVTNQGIAITANATAIGLKADKTVVDTINGTVASHTTDIKANSDGLKLKADSTTVNSIKGTVDTHTTQIKAASDGLTLKADKSQVDTIKGTVDKHTLDIKAAADGLTLKADSSLVNTIKGTVDTHTTQISANSTAINARLTSAQVETLLTGKKYVNETTLNATATSITTQITQVESSLVSKSDIVEKMSGTGKIFKNPISASNSTGTLKGYLIITTPIASPYMCKISISGYNYALTTTSIDLDVSFYAYTASSFVNYSYTNKGSYPISNVSLARNSAGKTVIILGTTSSIWSYPKIQVKEAIIGHSEPPVTYQNDWGVSYTTDISNFTAVTVVNGADYNTAISTIEQTVSGIQTTVASKADKSQITQLSTQISSKVESSTYTSKMTQLDSLISSKVESATYNSKMTQLDNAINLRVVQKDVTDAILADKTIKDTRATNQLPSWYFITYPKQTVEEFKQRTVMGVPGTATYGLLTTKVLWSSTSGGSITQTFSSSDGVFQRVSKADATGWLAWDKIAEAGKLLSQINLSTEGVLIQGKRIQLDGDVTMTTAFVNTLNTKTLSAITANITTIRSQVLTTDAVVSTHIKSDTALISKLFATDANVGILTAKAAFVNSVKAVDISATKITSGTLNASTISVINLNASSITSGTLSGINLTSQFNYVYEGTITNTGNITISNGSIKSAGTFNQGYGGTWMEINADSIYAENLMGDGGVRSLFRLNGDGLIVRRYAEIAYYRQDGVYFESGGKASIKYYSANARIEIGSFNGVTLGANPEGTLLQRLSVGGGSNGIDPFVDVFTKLNMRDNFIENVAHIYTRFIRLTAKGSTISGSKVGNTYDNWLEMGGKWGTRIGHLSDDNSTIYTRITVPATGSVKFHVGLDMGGYAISNNSDRRLKNIFGKSVVDSLGSILKWNFVDFTWKDTNRERVVHLGLIAQDTPELQTYNVQDDIYGIDSSKQVMMTTHAVQQLGYMYKKHDTFIEQYKHQLDDHDRRIAELEEKIRKLEAA